jgi:hypothetical protein
VVEVLVSWSVFWSVVAAIAGIAAVLVTIYYGEIQRRMDSRVLRLAQEEAELRPKLVISLRAVVYHHRPRDPGTQYPHAAIVFNVTNDGRSAAHNVLCEISLDEKHLIPDDMCDQNYDFSRPHLGPSATDPHQINAAVLAHGPTEAHYRCVCDEVGKSEGSVRFDIPEWKPDGNSGDE